MKITFVVPTLNLSGGLRVVSIYAERLSQKGHEVTVVYPKKALPSFKQRVKHFLKWKGYQYESHFDSSYFDNAEYELLTISNTERILSDDVPDADLVVATWWKTAEWVNDFSSNKGKKVFFIHGYEAYTGQPIERVKCTYLLPFYKITIATWLVKLMEKEYNSVRPYLVPNSVNHDLFYACTRKKQDIPTLGFLFSETECKGVVDALQVIEKLKEKIPNLRVISFGANPQDRIKLPDFIELSINPEQEKIRLLYQQCDLWLCCSFVEGFGLTILEAMACRTPSVSTKSGGPEDIISNNVNGYLCDVNDVLGLTEAAYRVLSFSDEDWLAFSEEAYTFASSYSWDDAAKLFESSLQSIILES